MPMQAGNLTDDFEEAGPSHARRGEEAVGPQSGFGGPIRQNKIWFYVSALYSGSQLDVADMFFNKNANNPNVWTFEPDLNRPAFKDTHYQGGDARLTWQVSPRNKLGILAADQSGCTCVGVVSATVAPEADIRERFPIQRRQVLDWTSPVTNSPSARGGVANHFGRSVRLPSVDTNPQMITVNEQSTGLRYGRRTTSATGRIMRSISGSARRTSRARMPTRPVLRTATVSRRATPTTAASR